MPVREGKSPTLDTHNLPGRAFQPANEALGPSQLLLGVHSEQPRTSSDHSAAQSSKLAGSHQFLGKRRKGSVQHIGVKSTFLWKWELFSMLLSVGALLAIAGILFAFDNQPLDSWHAVLRPNTVISALSTLSKSALLMVMGQGIGQLKWVYFEQRAQPLSDFDTFDAASRAPLGSLQFLYDINWRASMASIGAVITLLALAMDPFVQQVVSYEQRAVTDAHQTGSLRTARIYDTNSTLRPITGSAKTPEIGKSTMHLTTTT